MPKRYFHGSSTFYKDAVGNDITPEETGNRGHMDKH